MVCRGGRVERVPVGDHGCGEMGGGLRGEGRRGELVGRWRRLVGQVLVERGYLDGHVRGG